MRVSERVIALSCLQQNSIKIFRRDDMKELATYSYPVGSAFGETTKLVSLKDGLQTFLFYSIRLSTPGEERYMGMIEILQNGDDFLVLDWSSQAYPFSDFSNYGPLNVNGGPSQYLITVFDKF